MAYKRFWWLHLMLAGMLALGLLTGCESSDDDDDDTVGPTTAAIPDEIRGDWYLFAAGEDGSSAMLDVSSLSTDIWISSTGGRYLMYQSYNLLSEGDVLWLDGSPDQLILVDDDDNSQTIILVYEYTENLCYCRVPVDEEGGEIIYEKWWLAKEDSYTVGSVVGVVTDQETNLPLGGVSIVASYLTDEYTATTTASGNFKGIYRVEMTGGLYYDVEASLTDYVTETTETYVSEGDVSFASFTLSEGSGSGTEGLITVEVGWGETSYADLDLRVRTPEIDGTAYTVRVSNSSQTSPPYAVHEEDFMDGPGPEVINIYRFFNGTYYVYAYAYTSTLAEEDPVAVFKNSFGTTTNTINFTDATGTGTAYWYIASINGATQTITVVNEVIDTLPGQ